MVGRRARGASRARCEDVHWPASQQGQHWAARSAWQSLEFAQTSALAAAVALRAGPQVLSPLSRSSSDRHRRWPPGPLVQPRHDSDDWQIVLTARLSLFAGSAGTPASPSAQERRIDMSLPLASCGAGQTSTSSVGAAALGARVARCNAHDHSRQISADLRLRGADKPDAAARTRRPRHCSLRSSPASIASRLAERFRCLTANRNTARSQKRADEARKPVVADPSPASSQRSSRRAPLDLRP